MKFKLMLLFTFILLLVNCNSESSSSTNQYRGVWIIQSVTPEIASDPNSPDCRLMNDQICFNDFNEMSWSYPLPDDNGNYDQPCYNGSIDEIYDCKIIGNSIKIYDKNTSNLVNWSFELNGDLLTVTRPNSITVYKKEPFIHGKNTN